MSAWEAEGQSDEWYTPKYIFNALGCVFDLDVAAPPEGPRHVPCLDYIASDSLNRPWRGFIWMNPPFGGRNGLEPWLENFHAHCNTPGCEGIALVPDRTSAPWFQGTVGPMDALLFLSPKVKFEKPDGSLGKSPSTGTVLMARGRNAVAALNRAKNLGFLAVPVYEAKYD